MKASMIIVGYRAPGLLAPLLEQLREHEPGLETIVIDVDPVDRFELPAKPSLYRATGPLSYAEAVNRGLALAHGEIVIFANDDLTVTGPFLATLEQHLVYPTIVGLAIFQQYGRDYVEGSFVALRRTSLTMQLGGLDEQFPGCFEDVDFSWRAVALGYALLAPGLPIHHVDLGRLDHRVNDSHALFRSKWLL